MTTPNPIPNLAIPRKPCGCGNPLSDGSDFYRRKDDPTYIVLAKSVDREFALNVVGTLVKGNVGDYICKTRDGKMFVITKSDFDKDYELSR